MSFTRLPGCCVPQVVVALILSAACGCSAYDSHLLAANRPNRLGAAGATVGGGAGPTAGRDVAGDAGNPGISVDPLTRADSGADAAGSAGESAGVAGAADGGAGAGAAGAGAAGDSPAAGGGAGGMIAGAGGAGAGAVPAAGSGGATAGSGGAADTSCPEPGGVVWSQNGHCYFPTQNAASWNVGRDTCSQASAKLASITSASEQTFVGTLVTSSTRWIGLSRFGAPDFSWSTGEPLAYTNWESGEPSTVGEAGAALRSGTLAWFSASPSALYPAICER